MAAPAGTRYRGARDGFGGRLRIDCSGCRIVVCVGF